MPMMYKDVIFIKLPRCVRVEAGTWKTVLCNHFKEGTCTRGRKNDSFRSLTAPFTLKASTKMAIETLFELSDKRWNS